MKSERDNLARKEKQLLAREQTAETVARTAASAAGEARARLEKIAGIGETEARKLLASEVEAEARAAAASDRRGDGPPRQPMSEATSAASGR